jgi:hypothetical protein
MWPKPRQKRYVCFPISTTDTRYIIIKIYEEPINLWVSQYVHSRLAWQQWCKYEVNEDKKCEVSTGKVKNSYQPCVGEVIFTRQIACKLFTEMKIPIKEYFTRWHYQKCILNCAPVFVSNFQSLIWKKYCFSLFFWLASIFLKVVCAFIKGRDLMSLISNDGLMSSSLIGHSLAQR